jgi:hypothetical protein
MSEQPTLTTYLPEIECEAEPGDADWEVVVGVKDEKGWEQFLSVSKGMVARVDGKNYLPVGIIQVDHPHRRVLVELPHEADNGVNRLWAPFSALRRGGQL